MVEQARRERTLLENSRERFAAIQCRWILESSKPRPQESQCRHRFRTSPTGTARRRYSQKRRADFGGYGGNKGATCRSRHMSSKWPIVKLGCVLSQYVDYIDTPEPRE